MGISNHIKDFPSPFLSLEESWSSLLSLWERSTRCSTDSLLMFTSTRVTERPERRRDPSCSDQYNNHQLKSSNGRHIIIIKEKNGLDHSLFVAVGQQMFQFAEPESYHFVVERRRRGESSGGEGGLWVELLLQHAVVEETSSFGLRLVAGEGIGVGLGGG